MRTRLRIAFHRFRWLALGILISTAAEAADSRQPERPSIVYILADDLGYGDVQALNPLRGKIETPHLDRLASQGMSFTDAHSGSSVCTPTRYGLLTGRYAWRTRLQKGVLNGTNDTPLIAAGRLTLPGFLRQQGYTTAAIGKWHLGFNSEVPSTPDSGPIKMGHGGLPVGTRIVGGPVTRGFDYFFGCSNSRTMSGLIENDRVVENIEPVAMLSRLTDRAAEFVEANASAARAGRPFFLYVALTSPHTPILPTAEWKGRSGLGDYGDFVMQTDAVVGQILSALEQHGLDRDTLVIFAADNGCSPEEDSPRLEAQGHFASAQFRGYKADIWEGGHRVPFFVRWPGRVRAASQSSQLICLTDMLATCADLLGATLPDNAGEDSVSFRSALRGEPAPGARDAVIHHSIDGKFAVREGPWKLAFCAGSGGWSAPTEREAVKLGLPVRQLFHLESDPAEQRNVQADHPDVVARLSRLLERAVADGRSTQGRAQTNDTTIKPF